MTVRCEVITGTPKIYEQRMVAAPKRVTRRLKPQIKDRFPNAFLRPAIDGAPLPMPSEPDWYYWNLERVTKENGTRM